MTRKDDLLEPQVYRDDARAVETLNRLLQDKAMRPPQHGNKRMMSAKLSQVAITGLKHIAKELGYVHAGDGNVSMLLEAIGTQTLHVTQPSLHARHLD
jgi:hypothetical protein